jgi:hypothetical protein
MQTLLANVTVPYITNRRLMEREDIRLNGFSFSRSPSSIIYSRFRGFENRVREVAFEHLDLIRVRFLS